MNFAFSSPLKAIQGTAIRDLTDGRFYSPNKSGRSRSPRRRPTKSLFSPSPSKSHRQRLSFVSIPTKPKYISNQGPPPQVHSSLPDGAAKKKERSQKVVISRFLLVDGNISFAVGTQVDGVITPDAEEVSIAKILDYVSSAELERFENQDFFDEDERERLLPPKKPRGRPRMGDKIVPSFDIAPIGEEIPRELSILPEGPIRKKPGRPRGSIRKHIGKITPTKPSIQHEAQLGRRIGSHNRGSYKKLTSTRPPVLSKSTTAIKKPRGRPRRQPNLAVVIPSFNGPQPQELESNPSAESESDEMLEDPKPQYSMVAASGLGQSDTEDVTSRDQSVENLTSDDDDDERSSRPHKRAKTLSETSPDPIADDSTALLRQFQARVYGPDDSTKGSNISAQQSKSSPTLDDSATTAALLRQFHAHTRHSSLDSSSSDSLMGRPQRSLKSLPSRYVSPRPLPGEAPVPQDPPPRDNPATIPASYINNSITISHTHRQPAKATPKKQASPSNHIQRKVSLTPHFPPSTSFSHKSTNGSAESRSIKPTPSQPTNATFSQSARIMPSPPKKRKLSPEPKSIPTQSSQASSKAKIGFAGLPRAKGITDYFAPKAPVAKPAPTKALHSPTAQLLDAEDIESEDPLAHVSSSDSISSEVIVVRQKNPITPTDQATTTTAEAGPQELENGGSGDESEDSAKGEIHVSNTAVPVRSTISPQKGSRSAEALSQAFEIESEDGEESASESDSESDSDSDSSEVMIVRRS